MKSKLGYFLLIMAILTFIVVVAILTHTLFSFSILDKSTKNPVEQLITQTEKPDIAQVSETVIEVGSQSKATLYPPEREHVVSTPVDKQHVPAEDGHIGEVVFIRGNATAVNKAEKNRLLSLNSYVFLNERIKTASDTKLKIKFDDGSIISQGGNSVIMIDEYLYNSTKPKDCNFGLRIIKGVCRLVTGVITDINPDRFKVYTKMATVGIRGCDLGFKSSFERDDIYVFELSGKKTVNIKASKKGTPVRNLLTGKATSIKKDEIKTLTVSKPAVLTSVIMGKGIEQRSISMEEFRDFITQTSHISPARYNLKQKSGEAVFTLHPKVSPRTESLDKIK